MYFAEVPDGISEYCYKLGAFTIKECLKFIYKGNEFIKKWQGREDEDGWIRDYDQSMFDVISGVY
jgi:hypothetical protein